jgi:hypothetical protein
LAKGDPSYLHRIFTVYFGMRLADGCRLDRDIRSLVTAQPFSMERVDQFYVERFPKTHGYVSRGVATK